jgi:hypothetical protein
MASGGAFANPDAMGLTEVAEFYCALLAGKLWQPVAGTRGLARVESLERGTVTWVRIRVGCSACGTSRRRCAPGMRAAGEHSPRANFCRRAGRGGAGMLMSRVPEEWIQAFKTPLPLKRLGFSKVAQLLGAMPQLKVVTNGPSCMVYLASAETGDGVAAAGGQGAALLGGAAPGELAHGELAPGETTKHVRDWLRARVERGGASGVLASRIPSLWAEDFPTAGPLPLKQMGVNKLIKFLHACSDIVRMARPTLMDGTSSVTELLIFPADNAAGEQSALPGGTQGGTQPPAPAVDPALLVRQGNQTWVKAAELSRAPPPPQESDAPSHQSPAGAEAPAGGTALTLSGTVVAEVQERPRAPVCVCV